VSRERRLRRQLRALSTLEEAIGALRALSAQHFRTARNALQAARAYRSEVEATLGVLDSLGPAPASRRRAPHGVLLVAADLGLCGDYTAKLAAEGIAAHAETGAGPFYCVGRRATGLLSRAGIVPDRLYPSPGSVAGLHRLLLPLVNDLLEDRRVGRCGSLLLVAARFEGAGHFQPRRARLLPVARPQERRPLPASPYVPLAALAGVVVREFVYVTLHETLLDALAAEHGKRLVVAESARSWLEDRLEVVRRRIASVRMETSTQEVLEVAAGARSLRRAAAEERNP
jgi:F-type H+-transporting ATPase subunit gamma